VTGGPFDDGEVRSEFYEALKRAELGHLRDKDDPIVFHDLRHTFGTLGAAIWPLAHARGRRFMAVRSRWRGRLGAAVAPTARCPVAAWRGGEVWPALDARVVYDVARCA
jgi:hypothetical protein